MLRQQMLDKVEELRALFKILETAFDEDTYNSTMERIYIVLDQMKEMSERWHNISHSTGR